jgi:predicted MPP superfamily phosphohydrolase
MSWKLWTSIVVVDVIGLAAGGIALWGYHRGKPPTVRRDATTLALLGAGLACLSLFVAKFWLCSGFGLLRLWCHVLFCVLAPLMLIRGTQHLRPGKGQGPANRIFGLLLVGTALLMEGSYVYARHAELTDLEVTHHVITTQHMDGHPPVRVVVLADLQTDRIGEYEQRVFRTLDELRPDLVLLAGDYLQVFTHAEFVTEQKRLRTLFQGLRHRPPLGMFAVDGDCDGWGADGALRGTGVRCLLDEVVKVHEQIQIAGLRIDSSRRAPSKEILDRIRSFSGLTILLGHAPDFATAWIQHGCDLPVLAVAGHIHGGQVVIPGFGPPLTLSRVPRRYASGFHRLGQGWLLVSRGVGHEREYAPRIRMFCRPELCVVELRGVRSP